MTIGKIVHKLETCMSTNDAAREFARDGFEEGMVVLAESQQAGRGTRGRTWFSPLGKGLYLSVILRPDKRSAALIPLVAGLAVRDAIRNAAGLETGLKWPNDVIRDGRKIAGVLCESSWSGQHLNFVILGIGLNVGHALEDFSPELRASATSIRLAAGAAPDKESLVVHLYEALNRWYDGMRAGRSGELLRAAEEALGLRPGLPVTLETESGPASGAFRRLRTDGRIVLDGAAGRRNFTPSEVLAITTG
jgi:BirA family biotin operon repressor/biotin-[acetyl-CoA-carboxylase] ligase